MNKIKILAVSGIWACFLMLNNISSAQVRELKGSIINPIKNTTVSGVSIKMKGVSEPGLSSSDGKYTLLIPDSLIATDAFEVDGMEILEIKKIGPDLIDIYVMEVTTGNLSLEDLMKVKVRVSTSGSETVFHTPSTVSVVDREMLKKYNFLNVAEMLRIVVGMDIYQTNIDDNVATSRGILQNFYANKILVMIENVPTYQPIYGNTILDRIDVNDIERIEVLKGPASVLYGSNAYMGVVNIIMRKVKNDDVNVRLGTGYHRFGTSGANVGLGNEDFSLFMSGNNGYESRKPYELTGKRQDKYGGDSVYMFREEIKSSNFNILSKYKSFSLLMNSFEYQHTFLGINPSFISGGGKPMNDHGSLIALKFNKTLGLKVNILADIAYDYFKRDFPSNQDGSNGLVLSGERISGSARLNYDITNFLDIETGVDYETRMRGKHVSMNFLQDTIISSNLRNATNIIETSVFSQLHFKTKYVNILGGLRYTHNSFSGGNFSGRISTIAPINENNSLKLIFGQSYRAPTMLELFFNHPTVIGNLNLQPEKANSIEFVYVYGHQNLFFQMLVYYNNLQHLIQRFTPSSGPPSEYQNLSSFQGFGYEFEGKYQNPKTFNAFFNYTYMKGIGNDADLNYMHIPENTFKFGMNKSFGKYFASVNGYGVTSVRGNPKLNIMIGNQFMLDLHFGLKHTVAEKKFSVEHTLSAKNVTNAQMLIPEYIRQTDNINSQATTAFGRRVMYILNISF